MIFFPKDSFLVLFFNFLFTIRICEQKFNHWKTNHSFVNLKTQCINIMVSIFCFFRNNLKLLTLIFFLLKVWKSWIHFFGWEWHELNAIHTRTILSLNQIHNKHKSIKFPFLFFFFFYIIFLLKNKIFLQINWKCCR